MDRTIYFQLSLLLLSCFILSAASRRCSRNNRQETPCLNPPPGICCTGPDEHCVRWNRSRFRFCRRNTRKQYKRCSCMRGCAVLDVDSGKEHFVLAGEFKTVGCLGCSCYDYGFTVFTFCRPVSNCFQLSD